MSYLVLAAKWRPGVSPNWSGRSTWCARSPTRSIPGACTTLPVHRHARRGQDHHRAHLRQVAELRARHLGRPCGECNACRGHRRGRFIDLLEIDAASNTGVDNVREVIDNAQYMPAAAG
jgi:DNA polymerase-3 subunit gamma/tau